MFNKKKKDKNYKYKFNYLIYVCSKLINLSNLKNKLKLNYYY